MEKLEGVRSKHTHKRETLVNTHRQLTAHAKAYILLMTEARSNK